MALRINELTSTVRVMGGEGRFSEEEITAIVNIVLERIREEEEHKNRVLEETEIRDRASEIEPY